MCAVSMWRTTANIFQLGYLAQHRINDTVTLRQNLRYSTLEVDYRSLDANGGWG